MKKLLLSIFVVTMATTACERPNSADFTLEQSVQAPLLYNKTYEFLGGPNALIDTTSAEFDSLFTTDGDGVVSLAMTEDFNIGELNDAIPAVNVDPTTANSAVGELSLDDFSSQGDGGNLGEASYQDLTGSPPPASGTFVPGASGTANISLDTDYFQSATIKGNGGEITFAIQNDLGLDLDDMVIDLNSGGTPIASGNTGPVADTNEGQATLNIPDGSVLQNLNVDVEVSWPGQNLQDNSHKLVVRDLNGNNLYASQAEAALDAQDFSSTGTVNIDDSAFEFSDVGHYIEIEAGQLTVDQIVNQIDLDLESLVISFPDIRNAPYGTADSLVIRFEGSSKILRSSSGFSQPEKNIDLSGLRIVGPDNTVDYNIQGLTEQTKGTADKIRTINETDSFTAQVEIANLSVDEAFGNIREKDILVSDDDPANGSDALDLFNEIEAEVISISGLSGLSDNGGFKFDKPSLSITYESNLGVPSDIIGAIVGVGSDGNPVYLTGTSGSPYQVASGDLSGSTTFLSKGTMLSAADMVKLPVDAAAGGGPINNSISFDTGNSNVDQFLNNLPSEIRFIGIARVNEGSGEGTVSNPIQFDPELSLDVPLSFTAEAVSYSDTTEADLGDFPNPEEDDQRLTDASVNIRYDNRLPFEVEVHLEMLDSGHVVLTEVPLSGQEAPSIAGAAVDANGFVTGGNEGNMVFNLNSSQLDLLHRTRSMRVSVLFSTTGDQAVKVRASDSIMLSVSLKAEVETIVD